MYDSRVKRRWSLLFWLSLTTLIGVSWLASTFGMDMMSLLTVGMIGAVAAAIVAFFAMIRNVQQKWPAAVVLICAGPFGLDTIRALTDIAMLVNVIGVSILLVVLGNLGTIAYAIVVLASRPPAPPPAPPVAPARVVD